MATKIQLRRGLASEWAAANPILASGEAGFETDTKQIKIGDGSTAYNSLPYSSASQSYVDGALSDHLADSDPHPQYETAAEVASAISAHSSRTDNPHSVTKAQVGLGNVSNLAPADLPVSTATQSALDVISGELSTHEGRTDNPHAVTKAQVGLGSVPNVDATQRSNHTGSQLASTISDFASAAQEAIISQSIVNNDTTHAPSVDAVHDALASEEAARILISDRVTDIENDYGVAGGLATLDGAGKISSSMLPGAVLEYKGTWAASTNTPTLANGSSANSLQDAGHIYRVSVAGTVDFGAGAISFSVGDDVILSEALIWERAPGGSLVVSVNGYQGDVVLNSEDILLTSTVASASDVQHALENVFASVSSTMTNHEEALDPHPQYLNQTRGDTRYYTKTQADSAYEPKDAGIQSHIASTSNPHSVTKAQVGLGSVDNVSAASLRDRSTHTGTQLASTISDFTTAVQGVTIDASKIDGGVVSNAEFQTLDGITTGVSIQSQIDSKQATITGAATTITSSNLIASRALTSDATGKVAVSSTTSTEIGYLAGTTSSVQTQISGKQATITGAATTITSSDLTASKALVSDSSGKVAVSSTTSSELGFVAGVTSAIQSQIDGKANLSGGNTFTGKQVVTPSATDPGLNIGSTASDPSAPANGDVWYNSTTHDVKLRKNGVTVVNRNLLGTQVLTTGTTYTPTAGAKYIKAVMIGGGGGGGGVTGASTSVGAAGGGGAGAYLEVSVALTGAASYSYTIGALGAGGTAGANNGSNGTATLLTIGATTYSAGGGNGGTAQTAGTAVAGVLGGTGGTATGGNLNIAGQPGGSAYRFSGTTGFPGKGADTMYGAGGAQLVAAGAGNASTGYGSGGSGGFSTANVNRAGGNGAPGIIIITEYA